MTKARMLAVRFAFAFALACASCASCGGSRAIVVKQASPNPFTGKSHFVVDSLRQERVFVGDAHLPEAPWLDAQDPPVRTGHERARMALTRCFNEELQKRLPDLTLTFAPDTDPGAQLVRPNLEWMSERWDNGQAQAKTRLGIVIVAAEGQPLDDVAFERDAVESSTDRWAAGESAFCRCGTELAVGLRAYLRERVSGK